MLPHYLHISLGALIFCFMWFNRVPATFTTSAFMSLCSGFLDDVFCPSGFCSHALKRIIPERAIQQPPFLAYHSFVVCP